VFQSATFLLQFDSFFSFSFILFKSFRSVVVVVVFSSSITLDVLGGHLAGSFSYWNVTTPETPPPPCLIGATASWNGEPY
jgi:hypothetical protein